MNWIQDDAMLIAMQYHGGTMNKHDGELYLLHVARVALSVESDSSGSMVPGREGILAAIAWLHDTLEDTALTVPVLQNLLVANGHPTQDVDTVINGVVAMTKIKGETNEAYYERVKLNNNARFVKLRDMKDNFRRNHAITDEATRARMAKKYSLGMDILG